jgi:hypothetical protein
MKTYFAILLLSMVVACTNQGRPSDPTKPSDPSGSGTSDPSGSGDPQILAQSACSLPEGPYQFHTIATVALMTGTWVLCSGPGMLQESGEVGIQFNANGTFVGLIDDNGVLTPSHAPGYEGTWEVYDDGEVDWQQMPNEGAGSSPAFEDNPRRFAMELEDLDGITVYGIVAP